MGPSIRIDQQDPRKLLYLDVYDYRRRRSNAAIVGSCSITLYLRKEFKEVGQPEGDFREQLALAVRGWRLIDRIRNARPYPQD